MRCMCGDSFADGGTTTSDHRCAIRLDYEAPPARGDGACKAAPPPPNHIHVPVPQGAREKRRAFPIPSTCHVSGRTLLPGLVVLTFSKGDCGHLGLPLVQIWGSNRSTPSCIAFRSCGVSDAKLPSSLRCRGLVSFLHVRNLWASWPLSLCAYR